MGNKESNESAAVKRQAEGGANPMYELLDLSGMPIFCLYYDLPSNNFSDTVGPQIMQFFFCRKTLLCYVKPGCLNLYSKYARQKISLIELDRTLKF